MNRLRLLSPAGLVLAALGAGCGPVLKDSGFTDVEKAVRDRSGLAPRWEGEGDTASAVAERVRALFENELTAETAVEVALLNNRRLQAAFEELQVTRAELVESALPRNPTISAEVRFPGDPRVPFEIDVLQSLLDLLHFRMRRDLARAAFEPAKLRAADEVLDLAGEVRAAFYSAQAADQVVALRRQIVQAARSSAELAIRQREAGNISDLDLENEQALYEQSKLELAEGENELLASRERLTVLMGAWGEQIDWRMAPVLADPPAAEPDLEHLESRAVAQRLTQEGIAPGQTFRYEFTLRQHGTQMYHSHGDEMVQIGLGAMGFFIIHPRKREPRIDRDFAIFLNEWFVSPGAATPNPNIMTDFNIFTFNSRAFPGTAPLVVRKGDRVRLRFGNVGQESHPIHLHGYSFKVVATDGGDIPASAQWPDRTVVVFPGQTRDVEFVANAPGDWALHCHRRHHPMNAMDHDFPNLLGVSQAGLERDIQSQLPGYMAMGETGMHEHALHGAHMQGPTNTLPMMAGVGQFGAIGMGGMFTVLKVREGIRSYDDPGWYAHPDRTVAGPAEGLSAGPAADESTPAAEPHKHEH